MAHSVEEVKKHIRGYWIIFGMLLVLTFITVAIAYLDVSTTVAVILALIVASTKGTLVACYFMHLISEKKLIYYSLMITVLFFGVLLFLPVAQHLNIYWK